MNIYTFSEHILQWFSVKFIVDGPGKARKPGNDLRLLLGCRFSFKTEMQKAFCVFIDRITPKFRLVDGTFAVHEKGIRQ